ncbi:MAG TPA: Pvc16 family protein [Ilumatobacteraceae bacterium]|nr:Pvc16 family protein [Ilumatobacteraceae bacterium]
MLEFIDESLESFLRATVPLSATDVDVSFDAPDREWSAKLTRPTINVFLWDIRRSASRASSGIRTREVDGLITRQPVPPVLELRYVLTAWTADLGDERALLAGLLRSLLANGEVPREYLGDAFAGLEQPSIAIARSGEDHMDVFKALEGQLKPGLNLVLTTEFDTGVSLPVAPIVREIETAIGQLGSTAEARRRVAGEIVDADRRGAIGATVRSPGFATTVNPRGRFLLRATSGDEIVVETEPPLVATVPAVGGVRIS